MAELKINGVVITIVAVAIGIVMIGSLLAPIAVTTMEDLTALGADGASWANIVGITVLVCTLGLVIVAINNYTKDR